MSEPPRSNHSDEDFSSFQRLRNVVSKIDAVRNRVEIHKDIFVTEFCAQSIVQAPRDGRGILSTIRNGDHGSGGGDFVTVRITTDDVKNRKATAGGASL